MSANEFYPLCPDGYVCEDDGPIPSSCASYKDEILKRAWIVVETIEERNRLCKLFRTPGKVVKVNKVQEVKEGVLVTVSKCYEWDASSKSWIEYAVGGGGTPTPVEEQWVHF